VEEPAKNIADNRYLFNCGAPALIEVPFQTCQPRILKPLNLDDF
jgi:hypothetical protein